MGHHRTLWAPITLPAGLPGQRAAGCYGERGLRLVFMYYTAFASEGAYTFRILVLQDHNLGLP